jgi:hypothetical protein
MQLYGDMKERSVSRHRGPQRVTVHWDFFFGLRSQWVLHLIGVPVRNCGSEISQLGQALSAP